MGTELCAYDLQRTCCCGGAAACLHIQLRRGWGPQLLEAVQVAHIGGSWGACRDDVQTFALCPKPAVPAKLLWAVLEAGPNAFAIRACNACDEADVQAGQFTVPPSGGLH